MTMEKIMGKQDSIVIFIELEKYRVYSNGLCKILKIYRTGKMLLEILKAIYRESWTCRDKMKNQLRDPGLRLKWDQVCVFCTYGSWMSLWMKQWGRYCQEEEDWKGWKGVESGHVDATVLKREPEELQVIVTEPVIV